MSGLLITLPLQLACQLINQGNSIQGNVTVVQDTTPLNHTVYLGEGYTAFPDVGLAYKYYENKLTWNAARKQCITEGGKLAVIDSFKKVRYVANLKETGVGLHTGIHRYFTSIEWVDVARGIPVAFIPWKPDANLRAGTGECTMLWFDGSGISPSNCSQALPAVCEIPIPKSFFNQARDFQRPTTDMPPLDETDVSIHSRIGG